ncbi:probable G-protein coupled receptor Mth-like 5 [Diaphorina citri]|uniref:Probable G-protein coupled receptor Mth-like 5 n=1 Tax=Diaphorina citri TaxID=121845 RepID=A0A3Q0JAP5_DIACI|nr:probable G-protein coupled receptor Mth-like 5 [Diaphorina citri]XP_026685520.1 probable G-protein coupled receptor Mth-like 5 [Diaphorina citri]XP_026685521.1 probable G-protein coupled receptor Mth-like 5 [Diaphorina citri]XP_026685522.1 probable G-protein coupled receptor Mth-like 5 [Diaphorina citri]
MTPLAIFFLIFLSEQVLCSHIPPPPGPLPQVKPVKVHKCCGPSEIMVDRRCVALKNATIELWSPIFTNEIGFKPVKVTYELVIGLPDCKAKQQWPIYHYPGSSDKLIILPDGQLRHYIFKTGNEPSLPHSDETFYDFPQGHYCLDKVVTQEGKLEAQFAMVCLPKVSSMWKDTDALIKQMVDPAFRLLSIFLLLVIVVTYFGISQLRDVVGNIIATMSICLICAYVSDLVRIYSEEIIDSDFYLLADIFKQISTLAAFFWLNGLGFYIWRTFRTRNVFLRITDGRKYFYYSCYVWGSTFCMSFMAVFSHFLLDAEVQESSAVHLLQTTPPPSHSTWALLQPPSQCNRIMGWLGISIFFISVGSILLVNTFFYLTTAQKINRMSVYGRIHHKMRYTFEMYVKILSIMSLWWFSLILAWAPYNALCYTYIFMSFLQVAIIFYICVLGCKRVRYLIKTTLCHEKCIFPCCRSSDGVEPMPSEWGEELSSINMNYY